MSRLVLKYHATRGKEVINLLEMLGANRLGYKDTFVGFYYYIECGAICSSDECPIDAKVFTLEEFLEKFPYKVGDKVILDLCPCIITSAIWDSTYNEILYYVKGNDFHVMANVNSLQPFKEETMEDKDMSERTSEINLNHPCFDGHNKIELIIPENWKFEQRGNKMFGIRKYPQYPKTYEECCKVIDYALEGETIIGYKASLLRSLQKLLICRDAWWKMADDWKPDWKSETEYYTLKYTIVTEASKILVGSTIQYNAILAFPTAEIRDAFYENFKDLIEQCKELL